MKFNIRTLMGFAEYFSFGGSLFFAFAGELDKATYTMAACAVYHLWKIEEAK